VPQKSVPLLAFCLCLWSVPVGAAAAQAQTEQSSTAARQAISKAIGSALQADMPAARHALAKVPASEFLGSDAKTRDCIRTRFAPDADGSLPTDLPPVAARALGVYRAYWRAAMLQPSSRDAEEERLRRNLVRLLNLPGDTTLPNAEERLLEQLKLLELHGLAGRTAPLRELMVWRSQTEEQQDIALPEGSHRIKVYTLDDFASLGWAAYATCDRNYTGGWVKPEGIYAVKPGWRDMRDESYLISFLGHETQHFADRDRYGNIAAWELEYRAKLAELALADTTLPRLLRAFAANQSTDTALPHPYANRSVLAALRAALKINADASLETIPKEEIKRAAEAALREDSSRRAEAKPAAAPAPK
jgi:hypothetical protein